MRCPTRRTARETRETARASSAPELYSRVYQALDRYFTTILEFERGVHEGATLTHLHKLVDARDAADRAFWDRFYAMKKRLKGLARASSRRGRSTTQRPASKSRARA